MDRSEMSMMMSDNDVQETISIHLCNFKLT